MIDSLIEGMHHNEKRVDIEVKELKIKLVQLPISEISSPSIKELHDYVIVRPKLSKSSCGAILQFK